MVPHTQAAASQHTVASQFVLNSAAAVAAGIAAVVAVAAQPLMSAEQFVLRCEVRMAEGSLGMRQA